MEKNKKMKEIGLKEYRIWREGNLRGHRMIGQWIINRYGLLDEDLRILKNEQMVYNNRAMRKRIKEKKLEQDKGKNF